MKLKLAWSSAFATCCVAMSSPAQRPPSVGGPPAAVGSVRPHFTVGGLRAFLYYHETGKIDSRDANSPYLALWNLNTGGGDELGPSSALLVLVTVNGPGFTDRLMPRDAMLVLSADTARERLTHAKIRLWDFFSERHTISVPVFVYGVGCEDVHISASLEGFPAKSDVTKIVVPLRCGE